MDCVSYFKKISELLTQTKVTDKTRADLSLSQGAELAVQMIMKDQKKIMLIIAELYCVLQLLLAYRRECALI